MNVVKDVDSWKGIAYWLNIDQIVALLLTGDHWISVVLHTAPGLQVVGKYYPIAGNLYGLTQWTIPEPYFLVPNSEGVVGLLPPQLTSLSSVIDLPLDARVVELPTSLTSLTLTHTNAERFRLSDDLWGAWVTAIKALVNLRSITVDREFTHSHHSILATLIPKTPYPNLVELSIATLYIGNLKDCDLIPITLTKLEILYLSSGDDEMDQNDEISERFLNRILTMTQLVSLTLTTETFYHSKYYALRHLPTTLQSLYLTSSDSYSVPVDVLDDLPSSLTALDIAVKVNRGDNLASLERLPLRSLTLAIGIRESIQFMGNYPYLRTLSLSGDFTRIIVPASVTSLTSDAAVNFEFSDTHTKLCKIDGALEYLDGLTEAMKKSLTEVKIDLDWGRTTLSQQQYFFNMLDLTVLQKLTIGSKDFTLIVELFKYLSSATALNYLKVLPIPDRRVQEGGISTLLILPSSLTEFSMVCHIKGSLVLPTLPYKLRRLQLFGVKVPLTEVYQLTELEQLALDVELISEKLEDTSAYRVTLEQQLMILVNNLPVTLNTGVITKGRYNSVIPIYNLHEWFKTSCGQRNIRMLVADMLDKLMASY